MKRPLFVLGIVFLAWFLVPCGMRGASRAVIVTGLSGSAENTEEFAQLAADTRRLLIARGFPADKVLVLDTRVARVTRDQVLQSLKPAADDTAADEFWLVLYGHSGISRGGVPAFQVSGPRLTADDLKGALDAIPSRQFVLIGTESSGGFLPVLRSARRTVVSATKEEGQSDQPRFPDKWVEAFGENPKAAFAWIAARAAALVDDEYRNSGLVQTESARLADPGTGAILEPPFGQNLAAPAETPAPPADSGGLITASDIEVKTNDPNAEWEEQPATAQTRQIIAEAQAAPNPDGAAAIVLEQQLKFTVEEDRTTDQLSFHRVYLAHEEAVDDWANCQLPQSPPEVTTRLQVARIIRPDGTSLVFNPAKLAAGADPTNGTAPGSAMVFLPNAHAGCVIEVGYRTRELLDATLPHVSEALPIQREVPVLKSQIEVRVPEKQLFHVVLKNDPDPAFETVEEGRRVFRWTLGALTAAEPLPNDAPPRQWQVWLGISSLPSWDEFATWYGRISNGSDQINDSVKKMAADLAKGAGTRMEKIQRAFEFVSALRYIAIELGVQGFRPRTPAEVLNNRYGDCKDKANLLVALLRSMDVDARFVLLNRGAFTDVSFPSWQFNHAICFVPKAPGTGQETDLWLDSTDSITPFGFIAPGDYGRDALVFFKEKAEFRKIAGTGADVSAINDDWDLTEDANGVWSGSFVRHTAGLADYAMRATFRALSPAQRRQQIYQALDGLWPACDLSGAAISDVSGLRQGVEIRARASNGVRLLPRPDFPWLAAFCSPARDRPMLLNDGQQFAGVQTVRLHFAKTPPPLPDPVEIEDAGQTLRITWRQIDPQTCERTAAIAFKNPTVSTADYPALRRSVRDWTAALSRLEL
jgi:hypothetical protein